MTHLGGRTLAAAPGRSPLFGVYPALVTDVVDPDNRGRVRITLPWLPDPQGEFETWARIATLMAGDQRGSWFIPEVDDEVLVSFEAGDPQRPYVIGALWNGHDAPPASMDGAGANRLKVLRSRNGVTVTLDDQDGSERFRVETPGGHHLEIGDGGAGITLRDANGSEIRLHSSGISIKAAGGKISLEAPGDLTIQAGRVVLESAFTEARGVLKTDTLIATNVVAANYTPGAGNVW